MIFNRRYATFEVWSLDTKKEAVDPSNMDNVLNDGIRAVQQSTGSR